MYQLSHVAAAMAIDLGLHKPALETSALSPDDLELDGLSWDVTMSLLRK